MTERGKVVHVPKADVTGLESPRCHVCEYPLDHRCQRCEQRVCITKRCCGDHALIRHGRGLCDGRLTQ